MNTTNAAGLRNYQFLGGLSLSILFALQIHQDMRVPDVQTQLALEFLSVCMVLAGAWGILAWRPLSPLFVVLLLGANQLLHQVGSGHGGGASPSAALKPLDLALCLAALGYAASHYRLLALRFRALPTRALSPRSGHLATPSELVGLLVQIPLFALAAQAVRYLLYQPREIAGMPPRGMPFLVLVWVLTLGLFVTSQLFRYGRRRQMDAPTARLLLQDVLWQETRGEQRRIQRWRAWRKIKDSEAHQK
jgi:hypothetical protein